MVLSKNDCWISSRIDFSVESGCEMRRTMTDSVYRVGLISKRNDLSFFQISSFSVMANEIRFAIDLNGKTKMIGSDSSNRIATGNDCVGVFPTTGSATETSHGLAKRIGN